MLSISNIERLPQGIRVDVKGVVTEIINLAQDNLRAVLIYGSATGDGFRLGQSDINMALVYKRIDFNVLMQVKALKKAFAKHRITTPLLLTHEYMIRSKDVFALEFGSIKQQHVLIAGEDVFTSLIIEDKHVRFCCEQQLRGKILRLRQMYLESKNDNHLKLVLKDSLKALIPVLKELMRMKGIQPPNDSQDFLKQVATHFGFNDKVLVEIDSIQVSGLFQPKKDYVRLLEQYLSILDGLTEVIDRA